jgi:hypothetical protein
MKTHGLGGRIWFARAAHPDSVAPAEEPGSIGLSFRHGLADIWIGSRLGPAAVRDDSLGVVWCCSGTVIQPSLRAPCFSRSRFSCISSLGISKSPEFLPFSDIFDS